MKMTEILVGKKKKKQRKFNFFKVRNWIMWKKPRNN